MALNKLWTGNCTIFTKTVGATASIVAPYNEQRNGLIINNVSGSKMQIAYGTTAVLDTVFTAEIAANGYWNMPWPMYFGNIYAIKPTGTGNLIITEMLVSKFTKY